MTCETSRELLLDIVYGEDVEMNDSIKFFRHLESCDECSIEYHELIETRSRLSLWQLDEELPPATRSSGSESAPSRTWALLQRAAAVFLIAMGAISMLQEVGLWPDRHRVVSEIQLAEMVHDMIVAGQEENWRVIGRALLQAKEDMEMQSQAQIGLVNQEVEGLELRFVDALEENNRQMRTLATAQE